MKKENGSAQVVEISFVLPIAFLVVLLLLYLAFGMFLYVHSYSLARSAIYDLSVAVGSEDIYWQIKGNYIDKEKESAIDGGLKKNLSSLQVLPGLGFQSSCRVNGKLRQPFAVVSISASYFGKQIYCINLERAVLRPAEFAGLVDFGKSIISDFDELKGIYDAVFR